MSTTALRSLTDGQTAAASEPRPLIPLLAPLYAHIRDLSYPLIRIAVGGTLLTHGWEKVTEVNIVTFAHSLATHGFQPALLFAYIVYANETIGAICLILGLFTRFWAASIAIEFAFITFGVHWAHGYGWTHAGGGFEYPLLWGLIIFAIALRGGGPYSLDRLLGFEL